MACEVAACRACLATDTRLLSLQDASLQLCYRTLTGDQPHASDGLPQQLCYECAACARRCGQFRERCLRAREALHTLLRARYPITAEGLRSVDRGGAALLSPLQLCPQPPALPCHHDNFSTEAKDNYNSTFNKHDDDIDIKEEWDADEVYCPSLADSIKEDGEVKSDRNEVTSYRDEVISYRDEVTGYCDEVKNDPDEVKSDDDEPLAKHVKPDLKLKKKEKLKRKKHKLEKHKKTKEKELDIDGDTLKKKARGRKKFNEDFAVVITLTHEEQLEELHKRQTSVNYTNSPYKCDKCYKGFVDDSAYANHMRRHQPSSGEYACGVCALRCPTLRKLRSHAVAAHARKYACRACEHVSNTSNQAREHEKWHKGFTYQCKLCGETFRKSTTHLTHVRLHHPTEFVCDVCGDSFVGKHGLAVHKKRTHKEAQEDGESKSVYCSECDVHFSTEEAWKRHTVTSAKHSTSNDFGNGCRVCGEMLESKAELTAHGWSHVKRVHADAERDGTVECEQCEATFSSARKCLAHFKRMHLGMKYPIKKNVVCEVCGKKCTSNATLAYHQRTHTGEKPFQCSECPKRFSIRQRLQIHERTHTGERPYPCHLCHKAFRHKPALNRHSRVHTGAKPYECNYCGKTFSQSNSMKLHVHTVHLKLPPPYRNKGGHKPPSVQPAAPHVPLQ